MMANAEQLITANIDIWTSAIKRRNSQGRGSSKKIELYGIKKLRELILELAVRGLLVPQDPNDEPASELIKKIIAEKAKLVKTGGIRKPKPLSSVVENERSFELPKGWQFVRLEEIGNWAIGSGFPKKEQGRENESILFSKVSDMNLVGNERFIETTVNTVSEDTAARLKLNVNSPGTVIFPKIGGAIATNKRRIITKPTVIDNNCLGISPSVGMATEYLYLYLQSVDLSNYQAGTSVPALSQSVLSNIVLGLPPLSEQRRIVAKVDELMALCDQLEQQTEAGLTAHETLVGALLGALTHAADHASFQEAWQRIAEHFDALFTTEHSIDQLKQTLLQLAVMGKLVPQDPNDEPASELLRKIAAEKRRLEREEGLRTKASDNISAQDKYIETPSSWLWVKLGNLAKFIDYRGRTPNKINDGIRLITAKNIRYGYLDLQPEEFISAADYENWMTRGFPKTGDILFTTEAPLGNAAIIDLREKFALAQRAICFQWHFSDISAFMLLHILAKPFQNQLVENATGMTASGIKSAKLKEIPLPLPPLEEQRRIVAKVDELMALCDHLKARLNEAQTTQLYLADAIAEKTLS